MTDMSETPIASELPPETRVAAYGLIVDHIDQILLVRIAPGYTRDSEGKWTLPGGGLHFGEDPAAGARREVAEETGYEAEIDSLFYVHSWSRGALPEDGFGPFYSIGIVYRMHVTGGELRNERDESTDLAAWVPLSTARALPLVELVQLALKHLEER